MCSLNGLRSVEDVQGFALLDTCATRSVGVYTMVHVAIVGERNDEDHTVPSVMKLTEMLTDEEVDELIPETDVDDTQCSERIVDVPNLAIGDRMVEVVTAFHRSESQKESLYRSSTCQTTHKVMENIVKDSQSLAASYELAQDAKFVSGHDPAVNW